MPNPCFDYDRSFFSDFTEERLVDVVKSLRASYDVAQSKCLDLDPALARRHRYNERRVWIEQNLLDNAGRIPGVKPALKFTPSGWPFVVLTCGASLMTVCYVRYPGSFPRPARYRKQLARDAQGRLWDIGEPVPPVDAAVYGILIHTPGDVATGVGSVHVGFPHHELDEYLSTPVNLAMRFPRVYQLIRPVWLQGRPQWREEQATGTDREQ